MKMSSFLVAIFVVILLVVGAVDLEITKPSPPQILPTDFSCDDAIVFMPPRSEPSVVVQVVSRGYLRLQQNFVYNMELHSSITRDHLYLLCVDKSSATSLKSSLGVDCVQVGQTRMNRHQIWMLRLRITKCLVLAGYNVLLSDADALWVQDPFKDMELLGVSNDSIVASRGNMPRQQYELWGATLCYGFIYFRAGGSIMSMFLDTVTEDATERRDDQKATNEALFDLGIVWDGESDMRFETSTGIGRGVMRVEDEQLKVILLPHHTYTRACDISPISFNTTVVAHCFSKRKGSGAMSKWMKEAGLWEDFEE